MATALLQLTPAGRERPQRRILPLENGDHLSGCEFLRRYEAMPEVKKAELVNGPGLWLDTAALLAGDGVRVMARLHEGLQSAEHVVFVAELKKRSV